MAAAPITEQELDQFVGVLRKRRSRVDHLIQVADNVCKKLEGGHSISANQQAVFRAAIDAANTSRFLGS